jgi:hypothetical protein
MKDHKEQWEGTVSNFRAHRAHIQCKYISIKKTKQNKTL